MGMPGRKYSANNSYRYGFNGKENDDEVKGEGNQQDYGMRVYDSRIGKFLSVDPITKKYPELTPYQFASNRPIDGVDLDGMEYLSFLSSMYRLFDIGCLYVPVLKNTTTQTTLLTVYKNIPSKLQDPITGKSTYESTPFNLNGTVYSGLILVGGNTDAEFNGLPQNATGEPIERYGNNDFKAKEYSTNGAIGGLGEDGLGFFLNMWNYLLPWSEQAAKNKVKDLSNGFSKAVGMVDYYLSGDKIGGLPFNRTDVINFLADGYLRTGVADNMQDVITPGGIQDYSIMRKNIYSQALSTAYAGLQIMVKKAIPIQPATVDAVKDLLIKYKSNGGGNEFDDISNYYKNKTEDE